MQIVYKFSKVTVCQTATDASGDYRIKWHSMSITSGKWVAFNRKINCRENLQEF